MTIAATDGACVGNPGPGGWAWVTEDGRSGSAAARLTTNNRMELRAVLELLRAIDRSQPLRVQADSAYVIGVFTEWLPRWRHRGMRTSSRRPAENLDLIEAIDRELSVREVVFEKVPGHAGHPLNEQADRLARMAADRAVKTLRLQGGAASHQ